MRASDFFGILVQHAETDVAEVVKIPQKPVESIKTGIEIAIARTLDDDETDAGRKNLSESVEVPYKTVLEQMIFPHSTPVSRSRDLVLMLCRMTVTVLDLALITYVGSRGSRFDLDYLKMNCQDIEVHSAYIFNFNCTLRRSACLDGFFDGKRL